MLCLRCIRPALTASQRAAPAVARSAISRFAQPQQQRTFTLLSSTRPTLISSTLSRASGEIAADTPTSSLQPTSSGLAQFQARGAKRDTYNPSHVVRKRRHGYLSRLRTRTGRLTLKRRQAKKRNTLSH